MRSFPFESEAVQPGSSKAVPAFIVISESPFNVIVGAIPSLYSISRVATAIFPEESLTV